MSKRFVLRLALLCVLASLATVLSFAQQPATGLPPLGTFAGGPFDTVGLANLDVHFSIPVFSRAGKGISFSYSLGYDSLIWAPGPASGGTGWTPVTSGLSTSGQPVYNWGWRAVTEAATGYVSFGCYTTSTCSYYIKEGSLEIQVPGGTTTTWSNFVYHDPSGGVHAFPFNDLTRAVINFGGTGNNCPATSYTNLPSTVAPDNSGYILAVNVTSGSPVGTVNAPGGLTIQVPPIPNSTGAGSITDANGNQISVNASGVITDTLGTTALTVTGTPSSGPVTYTYTAPSGAASVKVYYASHTVQTCFQVTDIQEFAATSEYLVSEIVLPDTSTYQFTYETTAGSCSGVNGNQTTGRIASVTLPTGGVIEYSYAASWCQYNTSNCMMADGSPSGMFRTLSGAVWGYARGYQQFSTASADSD